jgi:hypothetical protein
MTRRHDDDERLARWIGAVRADADPALWTRVRARIEAGDERLLLPPWLQWLMRPAALGTAAAALALVCGAGLVTLRSDGTAAESNAGSLTEALLDEVTGSTTVAPSEMPDASPGDTGATG